MLDLKLAVAIIATPFIGSAAIIELTAKPLHR